MPDLIPAVSASRGDAVDGLPPTQYLIMEVLAARYRLGEACWTFPDRMRPALKELDLAGLAWWRSSPQPGQVQVYLTDAGRAAVLVDGYAAPVVREAAAELRRQLSTLPTADGNLPVIDMMLVVGDWMRRHGIDTGLGQDGSR